jgi:cysteine desulfurase
MDNATTPIASEVSAEMQPFLDSFFGNPSSVHEYGIICKQAVNKARSQIAKLIGANSENIIFTSGGTESNNHAIKGIALNEKFAGNHIITCYTEHPSVIEVCNYLKTKFNFKITFLPVDNEGLIDLSDLKNAITNETGLISIMHANNETGTIQPIKEIGKIAKEHNIIFHCDAAQSLGKIPVDVNDLNVDLLSIAGHKLYAPKGIGALYIRDGITLEKFMHGGGQENGRRAGTENILEIVGLGAAAELVTADFEKITKMYLENRNYLQEKIIALFPDAIINGAINNRLPNTLNISIPALNYDKMIEYFIYVAASAGSACHSVSAEISPVLDAMKIEPSIARKTLRFSTGRYTKKTDIDEAVDILAEILL